MGPVGGAGLEGVASSALELDASIFHSFLQADGSPFCLSHPIEEKNTNFSSKI